VWKNGGNVRDIDKRIKAHHSLMAKGISAFMVVWVLAACAGLAGLAVLAYIALHFVLKFW
jgi:hypothetical protein